MTRSLVFVVVMLIMCLQQPLLAWAHFSSVTARESYGDYAAAVSMADDSTTRSADSINKAPRRICLFEVIVNSEKCAAFGISACTASVCERRTRSNGRANSTRCFSPNAITTSMNSIHCDRLAHGEYTLHIECVGDDAASSRYRMNDCVAGALRYYDTATIQIAYYYFMIIFTTCNGVLYCNGNA
jgi:hypothetical protein